MSGLFVYEEIGDRIIFDDGSNIVVVRAHSKNAELWDAEGNYFFGIVPVMSSEQYKVLIMTIRKVFDDGTEYGKTVLRGQIKSILGVE